MKKLLIEAKRAPLPKLFKIIMIVLFLSSGFLFFCAIMGFFSELNDGAGLGSVGDGTVIIGNSDGGSSYIVVEYPLVLFAFLWHLYYSPLP